MQKREIKMGSVQAFLILRSIISVSPGIAGRRIYVPPEHPDTEELAVGAYMIRYTSVISNRFDSTTFKRLYSDLYKDFTKPVSSRRFTILLSRKTLHGQQKARGAKKGQRYEIRIRQMLHERQQTGYRTSSA